MEKLDQAVQELAARDREVAASILAEAVGIPADHVDRSPEEGGDPLCGLSNHEAPRLEALKKRILEVGAVRSPEDVGFDEYGNLVWSVADPEEQIPTTRPRPPRGASSTWTATPTR
jgi:hypothetical protein